MGVISFNILNYLLKDLENKHFEYYKDLIILCLIDFHKDHFVGHIGYIGIKDMPHLSVLILDGESVLLLCVVLLTLIIHLYLLK